MGGFPTGQGVPVCLGAILWHPQKDRLLITASLNPADPYVNFISGFNRNTDISPDNKIKR